MTDAGGLANIEKVPLSTEASRAEWLKEFPWELIKAKKTENADTFDESQHPNQAPFYPQGPPFDLFQDL